MTRSCQRKTKPENQSFRQTHPKAVSKLDCGILDLPFNSSSSSFPLLKIPPLSHQICVLGALVARDGRGWKTGDSRQLIDRGVGGLVCCISSPWNGIAGIVSVCRDSAVMPFCHHLLLCRYTYLMEAMPPCRHTTGTYAGYSASWHVDHYYVEAGIGSGQRG